MKFQTVVTVRQGVSAIEIKRLSDELKELNSHRLASLGSALQRDPRVHSRSGLGFSLILKQIIELIKSENSSEFPKSRSMSVEQVIIRRGQMGLFEFEDLM